MKVYNTKSSLLIGNRSSITGYHTQECRHDYLDAPLMCKDRKAWLGFGYYFWLEEQYAHYWGEDFKVRSSNPRVKSDTYDIYSAELDISRCVNTVFDEEGYIFFVERIEKAINHFKSKRKNVTLDAIHRFLSETVWKELAIKGIIYDDKPVNPKHKPERIYSEIPDLYYRKRIQIVLFELDNIDNFEIYLENQK
jgi:hypothetical protein